MLKNYSNDLSNETKSIDILLESNVKGLTFVYYIAKRVIRRMWTVKVFLLFFFLPNKKESFLYVKVEKVHCWTHIGCFLFQFAMKLPRINRAFGFSMRTLSREKKWLRQQLHMIKWEKKTYTNKVIERERKTAKQTENGKESWTLWRIVGKMFGNIWMFARY